MTLVLSEIGVLLPSLRRSLKQKISLFAISSFDTDYLLVASETYRPPSPHWSGRTHHLPEQAE